MCLALFAGLSAFCSHDAVNGANDRQESAGTVVVSAANPCFNSKQDKVKVHRQFWCKLIPWNTLRIIPIRSRHEKKKSEVEIQSKGIEQKAKREIQVGRITQVTPLDFNFCHLIAFFFLRKIQCFPQPCNTQKPQRVAWSPRLRWLHRHTDRKTKIQWCHRHGNDVRKRDSSGEGEETRSGTEKRCSHNLQSGHPAWWSADNYSIFPTVNIFKLFRSKKRTHRGNQKCLKNWKKSYHTFNN